MQYEAELLKQILETLQRMEKRIEQLEHEAKVSKGLAWPDKWNIGPAYNQAGPTLDRTPG